MQRLLASESTTECPRQAMVNRAAEVVSAAMARGWEGPPFDVEVLASLRGLKVERTDSFGEDRDGCLIPGETPIILISTRIPRTRQRFTLAHEIAHTLVPGTSISEGERHWVYTHDAQSPVEQLCQVGASELLMPTLAFTDVVRGDKMTLELARRVGEVFDVSMEAALRKLVASADAPCAFVVIRLMNKPSELKNESQLTFANFSSSMPEKRLRVLYGGTSDPWDDRFIPTFKSIPDNSVAYVTAHSGPGVEPAVEDWTEVGGLGRCWVETLPLPRTDAPPDILCFLRQI